MVTSQIEKALKDLINNIDQDRFLFDLLKIYEFPKASITRLEKGDGNLSKNEGEYLSKNKFLFKAIQDIDPHLVIDELGKNETLLKHRPRFLIVTDYQTFLAQDLKTNNSLDIPIKELADNHEFFFPWMGRERSKLVNEAVADIKAATKMGLLYDLIVENNPTFATDEDKKHALNMFFAQLLFCLFAEDTGLFEDDIFTNTIATYSDDDGSDLNKILSNIFQSLDTKDKASFPAYCKNLPYVGGDLFKGDFDLPIFSRKARANIIEAGKLDWYEINPDIFGSMIQVISSPEDRASLGEHYTSVPNIMKVINPLFMDSLNEQFESCEKEKDYEKLLKRIYSIKIFDPASGSGNFLIVTFKTLCQLEFRIFRALHEINSSKWTLASIGIRSSQFYALTIKDFDVQITILSMYIAEHQMNLEAREIFGEVAPSLPFGSSINVIGENALRIDWELACPKENNDVFIIGNPPYVGSKKQKPNHKKDMEKVFQDGCIPSYSNIDYICSWIYKALEYMNDRTSCAFVSTSSICQGEHISFFWKYVQEKININFAYTPFKWTNSASKNAGVHCIIIGFGNSENKKFIYDNGNKIKCKNINYYLLDAPTTIIEKNRKSICELPKAGIGNKPIDGGHYLFSDAEKNRFIDLESKSKDFFYRWYGADEFLNRKVRWVLLAGLIDDAELKFMPNTNKLIKNVKEYRLQSDSKPTNKLSITPKKFHVENFPISNYLVIPELISETKEYLPVGYFSPEMIASNLLNVIDTNKTYIFSILSSKLHFLWSATVGGKMGNSIRYSISICYNSFPLADLRDNEKDLLGGQALKIIDIREKYPDQTYGQLYDSKKMPDDLKQAHLENDRLVDNIVLGKNNLSHNKRLSMLFNMYLQMEKNNA